MLIKITGAVMIVISSSLFGFLKSNELKVKRDLLLDICIAFDELKTKITLSNLETEYMINQCFSNIKNIKTVGRKLIITEKYINKKDQNTLDEYFEHFGQADKENELKRINNYRDLIYKSYLNLSKEYKEKAKLRQTIGICGGITIVILIF